MPTILSSLGASPASWLIGSRKAAGDHLRAAVKSLHVELHGFLLSFFALNGTTEVMFY